MKKRIAEILASFLLVHSISYSAEVNAIDPIEKCFLCNSEPSLTMHWQGQNSKALLLLIPGGEGYIRLRKDQTDHPYHQYQTLKRLTDPTLSSGQFDVVLLDSPAPLSPNQFYPSARGGIEHLIRIESVIQYYKAKTGLPIWLMGHSNGGISLSEYLIHARKNDRVHLISGMVVSGVRNESHFEGPINFPMLFIHHQKDGCSNTTYAASLRQFEKVKAFIKAPIEFHPILGGEAESRDPCRSGFHMYFGAGQEVANLIDEFISKIYK